jgi:nicotinate-nucleotide pyrophosphorylase (carboxylating)
MRPAGIEPRTLEAIVRLAIEEDVGSGDLTTDALVAPPALARARILAKEEGVLAGVAAAQKTFEVLDPDVRVEERLEDGASLRPGTSLLVVRGHARALLTAERTALNFLGRLGGIASTAAQFVRAVAGTGVTILDTRKTSPGMRALEKDAVVAGGATNHRTGLDAAILVKRNHVALSGTDLGGAIARAVRAAGEGSVVTAEATSLEEARIAFRAGAGVLLLDNFSPEALAPVVAALREEARALGRTVVLEASGGVTLENVRAFADTGVDRISVGALTRKANWLDVSMRCEPLPTP